MKFETKIKKTLNIKFGNTPVYDEKCIKTKVKEFNVVVNTNVWGDNLPKEDVHHTYIASISIDSVAKIEKMNYLQVYLKECKYKIKKNKMSELIDVELELDCDSE